MANQVDLFFEELLWLKRQGIHMEPALVWLSLDSPSNSVDYRGMVEWCRDNMAGTFILDQPKYNERGDKLWRCACSDINDAIKFKLFWSS